MPRSRRGASAGAASENVASDHLSEYPAAQPTEAVANSGRPYRSNVRPETFGVTALMRAGL